MLSKIFHVHLRRASRRALCRRYHFWMTTEDFIATGKKFVTKSVEKTALSFNIMGRQTPKMSFTALSVCPCEGIFYIKISCAETHKFPPPENTIWNTELQYLTTYCDIETFDTNLLSKCSVHSLPSEIFCFVSLWWNNFFTDFFNLNTGKDHAGNKVGCIVCFKAIPRISNCTRKQGLQP